MLVLFAEKCIRNEYRAALSTRTDIDIFETPRVAITIRLFVRFRFDLLIDINRSVKLLFIFSDHPD